MRYLANLVYLSYSRRSWTESTDPRQCFALALVVVVEEWLPLGAQLADHRLGAFLMGR
jgi:hypothetical protein